MDNGLRSCLRNAPSHLSLALTGDLRICTLRVHVTYQSVVFGREVIGQVISKVFGSVMPVQAELILLDSAAHPVELHARGLGALPAHVVSEDALGGHAVSLDRCGWLQVDHLGEGSAYGHGLLAVEENRTGFCFRGGSHGGADGLTFGEYWTIR